MENGTSLRPSPRNQFPLIAGTLSSQPVGQDTPSSQPIAAKDREERRLRTVAKWASRAAAVDLGDGLGRVGSHPPEVCGDQPLLRGTTSRQALRRSLYPTLDA
jgi:hypothetical protein